LAAHQQTDRNGREIAGDPLTWQAGASSKWQFVFHLGTISRAPSSPHAASSSHRQNAGNDRSDPRREYYITDDQPWLDAGQRGLELM